MHRCTLTICDIEVSANGLDVSPLTGVDEHMTATMLTEATTGPTNPKPKRKQIEATASAVQQRRINDQALKKNLWDSERKKPDGMSKCKVRDTIKAKHETCPGIARQ
jgi:hypothetical protein